MYKAPLSTYFLDDTEQVGFIVKVIESSNLERNVAHTCSTLCRGRIS